MSIIQTSCNLNHQSHGVRDPGILQGPITKWSLLVQNLERISWHFVSALKPLGYHLTNRFSISTLMNWNLQAILGLVACLVFRKHDCDHNNVFECRESLLIIERTLIFLAVLFSKTLRYTVLSAQHLWLHQ